MKIWKSIVSLGLSLALTLPAAAAAFTDQAEIRHKEAVDGCVRLGIIGGYPEGDFRPQGGVTRAQMCKLICIAVNGGTEPDLKAIPNKVTFTDTASSWAKISSRAVWYLSNSMPEETRTSPFIFSRVALA